MRIEAEPGTNYSKDIVTFRSSTGIVFNLENNFIVGDTGWGYAKVKSKQKGNASNVDALTINSINNGRLQHQNNIPFIFIFFLNGVCV